MCRVSLLFNVLFITLQFVRGQEAPFLQKMPENLIKKGGQKLKITCALESGSSPVKFLWFKDENLLTTSDRVKIQENSDESSILTIGSVASIDEGKYKCIAKNEMGNDSTAVQLSVQGSNSVDKLILIVTFA